MARSKSSSDKDSEDNDDATEETGNKGDDGSLVATFIAGALVGALVLFLTESYDAQLKKVVPSAKPAE